MAIFQVVHRSRNLNQAQRNTFYYDTTVGDPSTGEWVDIVDEIRAGYVTWLQSRFTPGWAFEDITYRKVSEAGLLSFIATPTAGDLAGTHVGDIMVTQIALLLSQKGVTTKPNRTRTYLGGWSDDAIVNGVFTVADLSAAESWADIQTALNSGGTNPLTRVTAQWNVSHTMVTVFNDVSGAPAVGSQVPATQRRRRIGVGI